MKLKVPFGLRDGELVEPGSVPNGKACSCLCPGCGRPLVAYNQGKIRATQYFGHLPGDECAKGLESAIHMAGKQSVMRAKWMSLPALEVDVDGIVPRKHKPAHTRVVERAMAAVYQSVEAEIALEVSEPSQPLPPQGDLFGLPSLMEPKRHLLRPDLKADRDSVIDWIEVCVTHAVDAPKRWLMQQAGLRVIEVDLSGLLRPGVTLDDVRHAVLDSIETKTWLAHPAVPDASEAFRRELERESERAALEEFRNRDPYSQPSQQWQNSVAAMPAIVIPRPTDVERLRVLREQLGLQAGAPWPSHLDLDLPGNGGTLVSPRVWLSWLYLNWIYDGDGASFLVSDLHAAVRSKFGLKSPWGYRDLSYVLTKRVLPYWVACGLVTVKGEVVVVTRSRLQR